jgi:Sap-like sulfolipid-1-addressing protein
VIAQAAGFALLAAISPTALLVMAVFLGSESPRRIALLYFVGAALMTVVMAVTVLLVLRATGMNQPREHTPRYGLRLGLGIVALAAGAAAAVRARRAAPAAGKPGMVSRLTSRPRPVTAFLAGLLLFVPSASFIAAVQVIATANASTEATVAAMLIVIALTATTVWLPLIAYLATPEATTRALRNANGWLVAHGRTVVVYGLAVAGVILVVNGALNL